MSQGGAPSNTGSGRRTSPDEIDLREQNLSRFIDDAFRILSDADISKEIAFRATSISPLTTRTITMVDRDLDLATVSNSFPTDAGTAAPTRNELTIIGGPNVDTVGEATTITINALSGAQVVNTTALDDADSSYTVLPTDYYLTCDVSGGVLVIELPATTSTGRVVIVKDAGGDANTHNIKVTTEGGAVSIDGSTAFVMHIDYESANFLFNGTSYEVF